MTLERQALIKALIEDFVAMFPDADRPTLVELHWRLVQLTDDDLKILVAQLKPKGSK